VAVPGAFPAVARDLEGPADTARRHDDGARTEDFEPPALALVPNDPRRAAIRREQADDRELHVDVDAAVDALVLQRPDHLEPGAIADVRKAWIAVPPEVALEDPAINRPVEHGAPGFELAHPVGSLACVELGHPPVVDILSAAHRVREVHPPAVAIVHVGERGGHSAFRHHCMRLAEKRFADQPDLDASRGCLDGRAQSSASGAYNEDVVLVGFVSHQLSRSSSQSCQLSAVAVSCQISL
jgi:hypothetical protein